MDAGEKKKEKILGAQKESTERIRATLAASIYNYRQALRLSRAELGAKVGATELTIGQYERNARTPPIETLCKLADVLGQSIDSLVGRTERDFDIVKDYRYDEAASFFSHNDFSVEEDKDSGRINIVAQNGIRSSYTISDGVVIPAEGDEELFRVIISFENKMELVYFYDDFKAGLLFSDDMKNILDSVFVSLKKYGIVHLPHLKIEPIPARKSFYE